MTVTDSPLLAWLIAGLIAFWLTPYRFRRWALLASGLGFFAVEAPVSGAVLLGLTASTYVLGRTRAARTGWFSLALVILCFLGLFGYKWVNAELSKTLVPQEAILLGFSFYILRIVHYLIEQHKGTFRDHGFIDYAAYHFFLPTILVGPIHRFDKFLVDLNRVRWNGRALSLGLERALYGVVKIVVLGNYVIARLTEILHGGAFGPFEAYLVTVARYASIYVQFSGYADLAVGISLAMGLQIIENFNRPYLSDNITRFWQCWHISLSRWTRDYVFAPLAAVLRRRDVAIILAMLFIGLWHALSLTFILWGAVHGVAIALYHAFERMKAHHSRLRAGLDHPLGRRFRRAGAYLLTQNFVLLSFVLAQSSSLASAAAHYRAVFAPFLTGVTP